MGRWLNVRTVTEGDYTFEITGNKAIIKKYAGQEQVINIPSKTEDGYDVWINL